MTNHVVSATDPLLAASTADVRRQADELRQLVREAVELLGREPPDDLGSFTALKRKAWCDHRDDWLRKAREAAK